MEHFDELVTDPAIRLADVEAHPRHPERRGRALGRALQGSLHLGEHGQAGSLPVGSGRVGHRAWPPTTAPSTGPVWGPGLPTARGWRW